jgi:hypothetical protein
MTTPIPFPGKFLTRHDREKRRWLNVAFVAAIIAGHRHEERLWLGTLLRGDFKDVPDKQPDPNDTEAYAAFAVRTLLEVLTEDTPAIQQAGEAASQVGRQLLEP